MEALPFPHPLSPGGSQSCWEVSSSQPTFREACSEGEMHQESSAKSAARENFGLIFVCSDYNLSYASSLQRPKGKASVSASADRRQEGEMLEAGCPSGPRVLALKRQGPRQGVDTAWHIGSPCSAEWKQKGILAPGWSGHTKSFSEFPLAPEVQWLELEAQ